MGAYGGTRGGQRPPGTEAPHERSQLWDGTC
jgi:hypothetical protein